jgi:hypothetical protein
MAQNTVPLTYHPTPLNRNEQYVKLMSKPLTSHRALCENCVKRMHQLLTRNQSLSDHHAKLMSKLRAHYCGESQGQMSHCLRQFQLGEPDDKSTIRLTNRPIHPASAPLQIASYLATSDKGVVLSLSEPKTLLLPTKLHKRAFRICLQFLVHRCWFLRIHPQMLASPHMLVSLHSSTDAGFSAFIHRCWVFHSDGFALG